ncbi:YciI family protein [Actinoplanes sp. TRM 88003]|uniref:YciI family protein n=1 Tax=Paractinoplanes aksuensis TaxID=2939490 RepID=A0ABT1DZX6_9ACTN|nr:YciI family protein [Actinoplanes aksuensis]MCO8276417.1 YciI family protein [Actinoplanes aksuensis]
MKYLILIQSNPRSLAIWDKMSDAERTAFGRGHLELNEEMAEAGVHVASEGLADPSLARFVSVRDGETKVRDGETIISDGPYAEVKEHLAGFYLIDVPSLDEAVAWAAKVPDAANTEVEVRPVLDMSGWEF